MFLLLLILGALCLAIGYFVSMRSPAPRAFQVVGWVLLGCALLVFLLSMPVYVG